MSFQNITIPTERLILREFKDFDQEAVFDIAMQPGFHFFRLLSTERYTPLLDRHPTIDDVKNSSSELVRLCKEKTKLDKNGLPEELKMAICLPSYPYDPDPKLIGYMSLGALLDPKRDIGYFLDPRENRNGYIAEAGQAVIKTFYQIANENPALFGDDALDIEATVHPTNIKSCNVLSRLQFKGTGEEITTMVQGIEEPRLCYHLKQSHFMEIPAYAHH